jgi:hypothetical protein
LKNVVSRNNYKVKGRSGEELCCYVPEGTIHRVDQARGKYFTRSRFVLYALDRAIEEVSNGTMKFEKRNNTPLGASVGTQAPNSQQDSPNTSPNPSLTTTEIVEEELAGVR